jgi:hypothetical protein
LKLRRGDLGRFFAPDFLREAHVGRRQHRGNCSSTRAARRSRRARHHQPQSRPGLARRIRADRKSLLLGTALASTLLIASLLTPTPAAAVPCDQNPPFAPDPIIDFNVPDALTCVNTADRNNDAVSNVILLTTTGVGSYVDLHNSGELTAFSAAAATGIYTTKATPTAPSISSMSATSRRPRPGTTPLEFWRGPKVRAAPSTSSTAVTSRPRRPGTTPLEFLRGLMLLIAQLRS